MNEINTENKNPRNNIGALWNKTSAKSDYFLIKVTLDGNNHTLVAFPNTFKQEGDTSRAPDFYVFPFIAKEKE